MNTYVVCTLLLGIVSFANAGCPKGFTSKTHGCYKLLPQKKSFNEHKADCEKEGGFIAVPTSAQTNAEILSMINEVTFIGINDKKKEGQFVSDRTGQSLVYLNWNIREGHREPNDAGGNEDCGEMLYENIPINANRKGKWNDINCDVKRPAVCEVVCNYKANRGACYVYHPSKKTKSEAQEACKNSNGRLAEPRCKCDFDFIASLTSERSFLGISVKNKKGTFDSSGDHVKTLPWASGEPNGVKDIVHCVELYTNGQINDHGCHTKRGYVCEY